MIELNDDRVWGPVPSRIELPSRGPLPTDAIYVGRGCQRRGLPPSKW